MNKFKKIPPAVLLMLACCMSTSASAQPPDKAASVSTSKSAKKPALDHSGEARRGKASYYGKEFHGKKMADGTPMNPNSNVAASRTLPLGTKAKVTNLDNGKSEVVEIRDRGPYVDGRIVDVSPHVAEKLDMKKEGVAPVVVKPIEVPQPNGDIKLGAGASNAADVENSSGQ